MTASSPAPKGELEASDAPSFDYAIRVFLPDTDAVGVVYHGTYARFADMARTEWLRSLGWPISRFANEYGLSPVVHRMEIDYKRPAKVDDLLHIRSTLADIGPVRTTIDQVFLRDGQELVRVRVVLVFITQDGRPARQPTAFLRHFATAMPE